MARRLLSEREVAQYHERGYAVVESLVPEAVLDAIDRELAVLLDGAGALDAGDSVFDLEDSHRRGRPRVRRIKMPHSHSAAIDALLHSPLLLDIVAQLVGPNIRVQSSKLNLKSAGHGAPVDWHQDWAFYPHTNGDVLAVGIMLDAMTLDNGPLMVIPGSHRGALHDHHHGGIFCGAIDLAAAGVDPEADAVALTGPRGSISIHHALTVHGSALNRSGSDRRLLLIELMAADAWPLMFSAHDYGDFNAFQARMVAGEATRQPRLEALPVRIPQPSPQSVGSIYEVQKAMRRRHFDTYDESLAPTE